MKDLTDLRKIAEAATPGPWVYGDNRDGLGNKLHPAKFPGKYNPIADFEYTEDEDAEHIATFDPASIPALALAELEAAGYKEAQGNETTEAAHHFGMAMLHLSLGIKEQDYITAEAKEQAELEAEALELLNVVREARGIKPHLTAGEASPEAMNEWLAVARKAREMRKS